MESQASSAEQSVSGAEREASSEEQSKQGAERHASWAEQSAGGAEFPKVLNHGAIRDAE